MSSRRNGNMQYDAQSDNGYNYNAGNSGSFNGQPNMNNFSQFFNNLDLNQILGQISQMMGSGPQQGGFMGNPQMQPPKPSVPRDPRIQLLQAMKPFVNRRRSLMIDSIAQLYSIAKIIKGSSRR